jgi:hypothetical protein
MDIIKFSKFNENVRLSVLDIVIDSNGKVYNGRFGDLIKGNVVFKKVKGVNIPVDILGSDNKSYVAGIDKNGYLVAPPSNIKDDCLFVNGDFVKIPIDVLNSMKKKDSIWRFGVDYTQLLSSESTGWVNVKIDMEIFKRVKRYSSGLGSVKRGHPAFISKLEDLNSINFIKKRKRSIKSIQREMSVIMLLHYIEEIKSFFTPSAAGFLFESFIAGLIPNAKVISDNSEADIVSDGRGYQVKTLDAHNNPSVEFIMRDIDGVKQFLDHYVVCFKYADKVEIYILDGDESSPSYCGNLLVNNKLIVKKNKKNQITKTYRESSYSRINTSKINPYVINLLGIDESIDIISMGLKETLNKLYNELSSFQYNVETIVAGVNKDGKLIGTNEFDDYSNLARKNAEIMKGELENLIKHYKRD